MDISTHFAFHHKVFSMAGSYFSTRKDGSAPHFATPMGDAMALIELPDLRKEFSIAEDSDDGRLLSIVERALKFVKIIRVNDAIPNELLDGTASWSVEDRHRLFADGRLTLQLIAWVTGKPAKRADMAGIAADLEKPEIKTKVKDSIGKLSQQLGLGEHGSDEVEKRIDILAHELSFIEALRERFSAIHEIDGLAEDAAAICRQRMAAQDNVDRVPVLLTYAFQKLNSEFKLLDKQNQGIAEMLQDVDTAVSLIRAVRDEIHCSLKIWDEILDTWQSLGASQDETKMAEMLADTHRFLAENYPIVHVW